jgi:hypothetical protein
MEFQQYSLEDAEKEAISVFRKSLARYFDLTARSFQAIGEVLSCEQESSDLSTSCRVSWHLLCRISNELRCSTLLAERGYALQAGSLVANLYELARTVVIMGKDDVKANDWLSHVERSEAWPPPSKFGVQEAFRKGLLQMGVADQDITRILDGAKHLYQSTCMSKHANPVLQQFHSLDAGAGQWVDTNGPMTTEFSEQLIRHALVSASVLGILALSRFVECHVPDQRKPRCLSLIAELKLEAMTLAAEGAKQAEKLQHDYGQSHPPDP